MAEISVIIPAYNAAKTIEQCLNSILNQTFKDLEIIIVNDASTDNTVEIVKKIISQNPKINFNLILNTKNLGAPATRNWGAKEASGTSIIFCDADIVMKPMMLEKMASALKNHTGVAYAYSAFIFGVKTFRLWPFDAERLKKMPYIHTTSLIRHQYFPGFDESLKRFQDWDLWLTMLTDGQIGYYIPEVLFTVKPGGTMSNWLPKFVYKINWPWQFKKIDDYRQAELTIKQKHNL